MADSARSPEFNELWRNLSEFHRSKTQDRKTRQQIPGITSTMCNNLLSPRLRGSSRFSNLNNGDSPGDVEASQDIIWDSTSPTQTGSRHKNTRVVEISDIVNRIIPKNIKQKGTETSLLHWIDDGSITCTPEIPKSRVRKRSSRQSNVEDLMKLARQFDKNMQQDDETSEQLSSVNNNLEAVNTPETKLMTSSLSIVKDIKGQSSAAEAEAELHALFDCSTQAVSGRLSEGSVSSEGKESQTVTSSSAEHQLSQVKPVDKPGSAAHPVGQKETYCYSTNNCADFDDDWENDDLLNNSFILAITQNPDANLKNPLQSDSQAKLTSVCKPVTNTDSAHHPSDKIYKMSSGSLQELCPKPKTTNRSTFKLESSSHFQPKLSKEVSKSKFTVIQPKSKMTDENAATPKVLPTSHSNVTKDPVGASSVKDFSDSLWDDGDDDALLYQICDSVERISNTQPREVNLNKCREKELTVDGQLKTSRVLPVDAAWSINSGVPIRRSSGAFGRSNSLPGTSRDTNYQGWNVPMKGANSKSEMSQSFPESHACLGTFNHNRDLSEMFQAGKSHVEMKHQTVTVMGPQNSKTHPATFKRNLSDSTIISSKVFVTSQTTGKCSAAEIEKKKQEALARRRLRMQNASKP